MLARLYRLLSAIQSPGSMFVRFWPPPTSLAPTLPVVVPNWSWTNSTSWRFTWTRFCETVVRRVRALRVVGVGGADAAGQVAAVRRVLRVGVQHARAARLALLGVAVRVVHEDERDRRRAHAVDRAVLGVGDGDRVGDVLAPLEEVTVDRGGDRHRRRGVADRDHRAGGRGLAGRVGDREPRRVDARDGVGVGRVRGRRVDAPVVVEVPGERDRVAGIVVAASQRSRTPPSAAQGRCGAWR